MPGTGADVTMTLLVDYWETGEPTPMPTGGVSDMFGATVLDASQWRAQQKDFEYSSGALSLDGSGHLRTTVSTWDNWLLSQA
jgi:hypothetical protein